VTVSNRKAFEKQPENFKRTAVICIVLQALFVLTVLHVA